MKLKKEMVHHISAVLARSLTARGFLKDREGEQALLERIQRIITEDLTVEDKLNDEVREILRAHARDLDERRVDYSKMFQLIKNKLVRERGLIL